MAETAISTRTRPRINGFQVAQIVIAIVAIGFIGYRFINVLRSGIYGPDTWLRFIISGVTIGGVYSMIAIGYTLVYGILFMINFAHGEVMMFGAFAGYFVFEALNAWTINASTGQNFLNNIPNAPHIGIAFSYDEDKLLQPQTSYESDTPLWKNTLSNKLRSLCI